MSGEVQRLGIITWRYGDGSASGLVGLYDFQLALYQMKLLREYGGGREYTLHEAETSAVPGVFRCREIPIRT